MEKNIYIIDEWMVTYRYRWIYTLILFLLHHTIVEAKHH